MFKPEKFGIQEQSKFGFDFSSTETLKSKALTQSLFGDIGWALTQFINELHSWIHPQSLSSWIPFRLWLIDPKHCLKWKWFKDGFLKILQHLEDQCVQCERDFCKQNQHEKEIHPSFIWKVLSFSNWRHKPTISPYIDHKLFPIEDRVWFMKRFLLWNLHSSSVRA